MIRFFAFLLFLISFTPFAFSQGFFDFFLSELDENGEFTSQINVEILDSNGKPVGHLQFFPTCQGHESEGCIAVGMAPVIRSLGQLTIVTENILLNQGNTPLLQKLDFTVRSDNTLSEDHVQDLLNPKGFDVEANCFAPVIDNNGNTSIAFFRHRPGSQLQVVERRLDLATGHWGPNKSLFPSMPTSNMIGCAIGSDGKQRRVGQLFNDPTRGPVFLPRFGEGGIPLSRPTPSSIVTMFDVSRPSESSPSKPGTILYNVVIPGSNGPTNQAFTQMYNPSTNQPIGTANPVTKPVRFPNTQPSSLKALALADDGDVASAIGITSGHYRVNTIPLNESNGRKSGRTHLVHRCPKTEVPYGDWLLKYPPPD